MNTTLVCLLIVISIGMNMFIISVFEFVSNKDKHVLNCAVFCSLFQHHLCPWFRLQEVSVCPPLSLSLFAKVQIVILSLTTDQSDYLSLSLSLSQ